MILKGYFVEFVIIDNLLDDFCIVFEEFFGLIVFFLKWLMDDEVIDCVNLLEMGLGMLVWSKDL